MDLLENDTSRVRFDADIEQLGSVIGHADRVVSLHDYCTGLLLPVSAKASSRWRASPHQPPRRRNTSRC
jgi:SRSO17 transposase